MENQKIIHTIDEYMMQFPKEIQEILQELRHIIKAVAPDAEEKISYGMPTFYLHGNLVHFAAYKSHIGFYPTPSGIAAFQKELSIYKSAKGSVQFPTHKPLPLALISKIVQYRVCENTNAGKEKSRNKKK